MSKKSSEKSDQQNNKDDNSVVASTSSTSLRELAETTKPETKITKRYKEQTRFEIKMIEYIVKSSTSIDQPKVQDDVISLQMASLGEMIRSSVPANKHFDVLIKLANEVHRYISTLDSAREVTNNGIQFNNNPVIGSSFANLTPVPLADLNENTINYREIDFFGM